MFFQRRSRPAISTRLNRGILGSRPPSRSAGPPGGARHVWQRWCRCQTEHQDPRAQRGSAKLIRRIFWTVRKLGVGEEQKCGARHVKGDPHATDAASAT